MALLKFKKTANKPKSSNDFSGLLQNFSLEVMPRTADKIANFSEILPTNTLIYIAHIDGTSINEMVRTAARLRDEGFQVMPHFPARIIKDKATLADWIDRYTS